MAKSFFNFIGSEWVPSASGRTFEKHNPSTGEALGIFPRSDKRDVDSACRAAEKALPAWAAMTPPKRGKLLFEAGKLLEQRREEFADALVKEVGKTKKEALGEVQAAIDMAYFMAGEGRRMYGDTTHSELQDRLAMTKRYPIGVVGIIVPWNFPISLISWKVMPALICGNVVVVKPAQDTPLTANMFAQALHDAGLPKGVLNIVHGHGDEAGEELVKHSKIRMVSFTGSTAVGKRIAQVCSSRLAKVSLELGGKNASIVMDDANLELAVSGIVKGAFSVAGERCTATSRAIVHEKIYNRFMEKLVAETKKLKVGPGSDAKTDVCSIISQKQMERVLGYIEKGKKEGAKLVFGGKRLTAGALSKGFYVEPTIFADVKSGMAVAREEIFGPVLVVMKAKDFEDAMEIHNSSEYGLSASIFTNNISNALAALDRLEAGVCYVNAPTFGSEVHLPFGGVKMSGNGHREVGKAAIEAFSELKTIYIDYSGALQNAQFVPRK